MKPPRYASQTAVSADRTRAEIERLLSGYGASRFMPSSVKPKCTRSPSQPCRTIRFALCMPSRAADEFVKAPRRGRRTPEAAARLWEQACRSRWRALLLVIRAKLEAAVCGISTIEDEFLAWTVLPGQDGQTVGDALRMQIAERLLLCDSRPLLLPGGAS